MTSLPAIELPINPESYYGQSIAVSNLNAGTTIYIGPSPTAREVFVNNVNYNPEGWYEVFTDEAVYIAKPNTRVTFKNS
jgi:hypothetical protein